MLHKNEAATRAALIDPVLRALGWDTSDVRMVEPERAGKKTMLLNWSPPKTGLSCSKLFYQGKSVYLYTNYDAAGILANACYLLQQLPQGTAIEVAFAF